jgi:hypothetical protein
VKNFGIDEDFTETDRKVAKIKPILGEIVDTDMTDRITLLFRSCNR